MQVLWQPGEELNSKYTRLLGILCRWLCVVCRTSTVLSTSRPESYISKVEGAKADGIVRAPEPLTRLTYQASYEN